MSSVKESLSATRIAIVASSSKEKLNIKQETYLEQANKEVAAAAAAVLNDELDSAEAVLLLNNDETTWRGLVFDKFKRILDELKTLQANPNENKVAIRDRYVKGLMLCGTIKKLNRISNIAVNKARMVTHEEKNKIDEHHLELQNLLYEISHLKKEINTCLEFRSLHEEINLIPLEEFFTVAYSEIPNLDTIKKNEHKLKLAELEWELIQRQNMLNRIKDLEGQIENHERQLKLKQSKLESLNPKLNQILEACKPTLDYFNTNFDENYMFSEPVQYLPKPLYHLFTMMSAYRDTMDKDIKIEVAGDLEEAKHTNLNEIVSTLGDDDDSDSGNEDEIENDGGSGGGGGGSNGSGGGGGPSGTGATKKKKSKAKANKKKTNFQDKLFKCFPLSCRVTFSVRGYGQFVLEFFYLAMLKIVTVKSEIRLLKDIKFSENSIFRAESIFDNLFDKDNGLESPNLANKFLFANIGIQSIEPYTKQAGMPYKWCQYLCGLYYDNKEARDALICQTTVQTYDANNKELSAVEMNVDHDDDDETLNPSDSQKTLSDTKMFERIVSRLKSRFKARICLQEIINQLKILKLPHLDQVSTKLHRFQIQSAISEFKESEFGKYSSLSYTRSFLGFNFINEESCIFFELSLQKGEAQLQAQVVVHQDYPKIAPLFSINIVWKYERNSSNDEAIRDMERNLNLFRDQHSSSSETVDPKATMPTSNIFKSGTESSKSRTNSDKAYDLLAKQIYHLLVYFDIYLEAESTYLASNEIQSTKLFLNAVRGRDRQRPYSYLASKNIFVQRMQEEIS